MRSNLYEKQYLQFNKKIIEYKGGGVCSVYCLATNRMQYKIQVK